MFWQPTKTVNPINYLITNIRNGHIYFVPRLWSLRLNRGKQRMLPESGGWTTSKRRKVSNKDFSDGCRCL